MQHFVQHLLREVSKVNVDRWPNDTTFQTQYSPALMKIENWNLVTDLVSMVTMHVSDIFCFSFLLCACALVGNVARSGKTMRHHVARCNNLTVFRLVAASCGKYCTLQHGVTKRCNIGSATNVA